MDLKSLIRDIPDFPKPGIIFKDITPILKSPEAIQYCIDALAAPHMNQSIDYVVGIESRGFLFGPAIAAKLGAGFIPVRKRGKLPHRTRVVNYDLEYGSDSLEIHEDAIEANSRLLLTDDLLATGGTMKATIELVTPFSPHIVGVSLLVELAFLNGSAQLDDIPIHSLVQY